MVKPSFYLSSHNKCFELIILAPSASFFGIPTGPILGWLGVLPCGNSPDARCHCWGDSSCEFTGKEHRNYWLVLYAPSKVRAQFPCTWFLIYKMVFLTPLWNFPPISFFLFFKKNHAFGCLEWRICFPPSLAARCGHVTEFWPSSGRQSPIWHFQEVFLKNKGTSISVLPDFFMTRMKHDAQG